MITSTICTLITRTLSGPAIGGASSNNLLQTLVPLPKLLKILQQPRGGRSFELWAPVHRAQGVSGFQRSHDREEGGAESQRVSSAAFRFSMRNTWLFAFLRPELLDSSRSESMPLVQ